MSGFFLLHMQVNKKLHMYLTPSPPPSSPGTHTCSGSSYAPCCNLITSLAKEVISSEALVCFSVYFFACQSVCLFATLFKKFFNGLQWNFMKWSGVVKGTSYYILVVIEITMLTAQSEIHPLLHTLWADFDEIFRIALQWYKVQLIIILFMIKITMLTRSKLRIRQYYGNELPCGKSVLPECSCLINTFGILCQSLSSFFG